MANPQQTTKVVRRLHSGQLTIPAEFRREWGLGDDDFLLLTLEGDELRLKPLHLDEAGDDGPRADEGSPWFRALYEYFAPVRQEILGRGISEEEVNADIDAAIAAVRAERRATSR